MSSAGLTLKLGIVCTLLAMPLAHADVVVLKQQSGNPPKTLQGTVMSVNDQTVLLQISDGTQVPLNRDSVLQIIFSHDHIDTGTEQQILAHPPILDTSTYEAPVPPSANTPSATTPSPTPTPTPAPPTGVSTGSVTYALMDDQGVVDDDMFILLSRFRGEGSHATYAGLYNFDNKGTFWIRLPEAAALPGDLSFSLFGKQNSGGNDSMEPFRVTVRYIDENGMPIGDSATVAYRKDGGDNFIEWFDHLDGISGLGGRLDAHVAVPPGTKTLEFRAMSDTNNGERHLVGYLGYIRVTLPQSGHQYGQ